MQYTRNDWYVACLESEFVEGSPFPAPSSTNELWSGGPTARSWRWRIVASIARPHFR